MTQTSARLTKLIDHAWLIHGIYHRDAETAHTRDHEAGGGFHGQGWQHRVDDHFTAIEEPSGPVLLERCVCGKHADCPDGWHYGIDLPCACTPDCAVEA